MLQISEYFPILLWLDCTPKLCSQDILSEPVAAEGVCQSILYSAETTPLPDIASLSSLSISFLDANFIPLAIYVLIIDLSCKYCKNSASINPYCFLIHQMSLLCPPLQSVQHVLFYISSMEQLFSVLPPDINIEFFQIGHK